MSVVLTRMTLLIPAFSLLAAPPVLTVRLLGRPERSPTIHPFGDVFRASDNSLSLDTFSVPLHSTSELLRTLSMMAASKPTSWLL